MDEAADNSTLKEGWIDMCAGDFERIDLAAYVVAGMDFCSIFVNAIHIYIISTMPALKAKPAYYHVLLHIALGDIAYAFFFGLRLVLSRGTYFESFSYPAAIIYDVVSTGAFPIRFFLITMASAERFIALCHPMQHATSHFITKMHIWLPMCWILSYSIVIIRDSIYYEGLCIDVFTGPSVRYGFGSGGITMAGNIVSTLITAFLTTGVLIEMYKMSRRSLPNDRNQVKKAATYVVIITIMFYTCLLPGFLTYMMRIFGVRKMNSFWAFYIAVTLFNSLYGFLNTIIYGWMTPSYRMRAWTILGRKPNQVSSEETS